MSKVAQWVESLGGVAQKQHLVALGATDYALTVAVRTGAVFRARQGWYSTLPPESASVRAVRVGGRLTGISAVREWGGWTFGATTLHVSVPQNSARLRSQWNRAAPLTRISKHGVMLHWDDDDVCAHGTRTSVALADALLCVIAEENLESAVAALDWALHLGRLDRIDFGQLIVRLPAGQRWIREWVDAACESFPESIARTRLRLRGHRIRSQVPLDELRRIDLVVEDRVALEVDGDEFHRDRFREDRRKDLLITLVGMHSIRPTASMVLYEWEFVLAAIEAALNGPVSLHENSGTRSRGSRSAPRHQGRRTHPVPFS